MALVIFTLLIAAILCIVAYGLLASPDGQRRTLRLPYYSPSDWPSHASPAKPTSADTRPPNRRTVYPYSVVPGGARNAQELREAISRDPLVAAHYSDFKIGAAHVLKLPAARTAYVSYRLGNKIYWTKKRIHLAKGEPIITDGEHSARVRCANRIEEKPGEVSPDEPSPEILDQPVNPSPEAQQPYSAEPIPFLTLPGGPGLLPLIDSPLSGELQPPPSKPSVPENGPPPPGGPFFIPPLYVPGTPPPPPVTPVPEPGSVVLLGTGLVSLAALRRRFLK